MAEPRRPHLILAIDAGGSSTRCLLADSSGTVLAHGRGGAGNHILSGWDVTRASITQAIAQACGDAAVAPTDITCAVAGSAGIGANGEGRELVEWLLRETLPAARVQAVGDMVAAFWGALAGEVGVVVAAGTGSVCYARNPSGKTCQVGGWGQILGDEGSAYDIAVRALRAGARAADQRGPDTVLTDLTANALGVRSFVEVALRVYGDPMTREAIAALATCVWEAANRGDAVARAILAEAGSELGLAAVTALRTLDLANAVVPVAYTGAVFDAGPLILESFQHTLALACPHAVLRQPEFPPVIGAFKLALRELEIAFAPVTAARLRAGLGEGRT